MSVSDQGYEVKHLIQFLKEEFERIRNRHTSSRSDQECVPDLAPPEQSTSGHCGKGKEGRYREAFAPSLEWLTCTPSYRARGEFARTPKNALQ